MKNSVALHPGQGAWVYLTEESKQVSGNDFIFPILFNTIIEKNLFASKFSPRAGVLRSPAIYMINHNNDIFVQLKRGESLGKLVSLMVRTCRTCRTTPEKEEYGSKPVALRGHAGSPSRPGLRGGHPPRASLEQHTRIQHFILYFVTTTVAPTLHVLSQAMAGAGAV